MAVWRNFLRMGLHMLLSQWAKLYWVTETPYFNISGMFWILKEYYVDISGRAATSWNTSVSRCINTEKFFVL